MDAGPKVYHEGELANIDSFSGMVPCKVLEVLGDGNLLVKITSGNYPGYKLGETWTGPSIHIYPRNCWRRSRRGPSWVLVKSYMWRKKETDG